MPSRNVYALLKDYVLTHDLEPTSEKYYRTTVRVFCGWLGQQKTRARFTPKLVSEFLHAKQLDGCSSHYRKSLRSGLRALLNHDLQHEPIRTVKLDPLSPEAWVDEEVAQLVAAVALAVMPNRKTPEAIERRWFWRTIIPMAWHSGLERMDLVNRFRREQVPLDGVIRVRRHKTKNLVVARLPETLRLEIHARQPGPVWPFEPSEEFFRRQFGKIVAKAGLVGTFKKLRKSSGTAAEILRPGRGHEHLANSRKIFEAHYLPIGTIPFDPFSIPELPSVGFAGS